MYKNRYLNTCHKLNYCIIIWIFLKQNQQLSCCYILLINLINILNTSNQYGKLSQITFATIQEAKVIIGPDNILSVGFTSDPGDDMGKEDKGKNSSSETPKNKVKNKNKGSKEISSKTRKLLIKKVPDIEILSPKPRRS